MRYPPGVSQNDFDRAVNQFEAAIGSDWVFTDEADVDLYRDAYSPLWGEEEEKIPSIALAPRSAEEVQVLMRICNEFRIPVYPVSTGKNLGYGGSAPVLNGSVVLDLKRMNRIIEVSEENAFALVEPGVSYFDLYNYIQEKGLDLWIDCPDPGWGSLIGNSLDHGVGYTVNPYRDHFEAHCGMEVVLADGDLVRTGMGAMPKPGNSIAGVMAHGWMGCLPSPILGW
jgi:FAD/FMN-containing dehydrogenase